MVKRIGFLGALFVLIIISQASAQTDSQVGAGQAAADSGDIAARSEAGMKEEEENMEKAKEDFKKAAEAKDQAGQEKAKDDYQKAMQRYRERLADKLNAQNAQGANKTAQDFRKAVIDKGMAKIKDQIGSPSQIAQRLTRAGFNDPNLDLRQGPGAHAYDATRNYVAGIKNGNVPTNNPLGKVVTENGIMEYARQQTVGTINTKLNSFGNTVSGWFSSPKQAPAPTPTPSK